FSSRRRHTRSKRDWSSDVCSSDLSNFSTFISYFLFSNKYFLNIVLHPLPPLLFSRIVKSLLIKPITFPIFMRFYTKKLATPLNFGFNEVTTHTKTPKKDVTSCTLNL